MSKKKKEAPTYKRSPLGALFFAAQVEIVAKTARYLLAFSFGTAILVNFWFSRVFSPREVYLWFAWMTTISIISYLVLGSIINDPEKALKAKQWSNRLILGGLLNGAGWGALSLFFYPQTSASLNGFLLMIIMALTAVSLPALSPLTSAYWAFNLPAAIPLCLRYFTQSGGEHIKTGLVLAGYLVLTGFMARRQKSSTRTHLREKVILKKEMESRKLVEKEVLQEKERAEAAIKNRREFMAGVGLELRTYLTTIIGFSSIMKKNAKGDLSPRDVSRAERINRNGRQLLLVIDNVLDLTRMEMNQLELELEEVNLPDLIEEAVELQKDAIEEKALAITVRISEEVPEHVLTDPTRLWQILNNLLTNAIKFTEKGGIDISLGLGEPANDQTCLEFSVKDTGIGIDGDTRLTLFNPFSHSSKFGGIGLGLPISKNLVHLMGGDIRVKSLPREGSEFIFTILCQEIHGDAIPEEEGVA